MFSECSSLKRIDLSNWDTESVKDISYMFSECFSLEEINLLSFNTSNEIIWMVYFPVVRL